MTTKIGSRPCDRWPDSSLAPRPLPLVFKLVVPLALALPGVGHGQAIHQDLWQTDGGVNAIVRSGNTIYVGGSFTQVGPATGGAAAVDLVSGDVRSPCPQVAGTVLA